MLNPATCAQGNLIFGLYFVISLLFVYIFVNGAPRALPVFLFAIANKGLGVSTANSAVILTTHGFMGAVGRGTSAFISKCLNIKLLLFIQVMTALVLSFCLMFSGMSSAIALAVTSCLLNFMLDPIYPSIMAWADRFIIVTGSVVAIIDIGIGLGEFVALFIAGVFFQNRGSQSILTLCFLLTALVVLVYIPLQAVSWRHGDRHEHIETAEEMAYINKGMRDSTVEITNSNPK